MTVTTILRKEKTQTLSLELIKFKPNTSEILSISTTQSPDLATHREWTANPTNSDGIKPTAWAAATADYTNGVIRRYFSSGGFDWAKDEYVIHPGNTSRGFAHTLASTGIILDGNMHNRVGVQALANIGSGKIDLGVALGEGRKTLSSVAQATGEALRLLIAIKHGDIKTLKKLFPKDSRAVEKQLSKRWLQYQYGFKPLANDIQGLVDIHNDGLEKSKNLKTYIHGKSSASDIFQNTFLDGKIDERINYRNKARLRATLADSGDRGMSILGLDNPAAIAWEVVPFSFVVDWFLPIGTILNAIQAKNGLRFEFGSVSTKCKLTSVYHAEFPDNPENSKVDVSMSINGFRRDILGGWPPILAYTKNPFSGSHVTTALALMSTLSR